LKEFNMSEAVAAEVDLFAQIYGLSKWEYGQLLVAYERFDQEDSSQQACDRLVFKPEDAAELKELLEYLKTKPRARALVAMLMDVRNHHALAKRVEDALPLVPKERHQPPRADTVGMFFAANVPLSEQSHLAST
jgi:hypothetical protein